MITPDDFLSEATGTDIDWSRQPGYPVALQPEFVQIGTGPDGFEVAFARTTNPSQAPKAEEVRALWKSRWNRRAAPVALVVAHQDSDGGWKASVCGTKDDPAVLTGLPLDRVDRIVANALAAPDPATADRTFHRLLVGQKDALVAGLTNVGLFASHELRTGVPKRSDYDTARNAGQPLLTARGKDLIRGLGYSMAPYGSTANILSTGGTNRAVAVFLDEHEVFDRASDRFNATSPVAQGMAIAAAQNLPWLLINRGAQIRLYPTSPDVGVGRKGQAETYIEVDLALLAPEDAAYLYLIFSADALAERGTADQILAASADHAAALGARLRTRVYKDVVPALAVAVADQMGASTQADLDEAYHRTLTILFRLLFVAYAEDRGLLPYQRNPRYTRKALKTVAREFTDDPDVTFDAESADRWNDLLAVWKAVDDGNTEWGVPAYNGGLFATGADHPTGQAIAAMTLSNAQIGPALRHLLIDTGDEGTVGPVDFRSLSVREFGTLYEGLLESSLSVAPSDLTVDDDTATYRPAMPGEEIVAPEGTVYFHNASGKRKATGSYFTKQFVVEHLMDSALEPALDAHIAKIAAAQDRGDDAAAAEHFFDFRVVDLAMGSGHFLVAAIDRIERRLSAHLADRPIAQVTQELTTLASVARDALGSNSADIEIEPSGLLRRQIARRCLYGLDLNLMAVELARLAIWIHTFVPGLPMSALDHGLVVGNSLTGIGTVDEVLDILEPQREHGQYSLLGERLEAELGAARAQLLRIARTTEATKREVRAARQAHRAALADAAGAKALLDAALAVRLGMISMPFDVDAAIAAGTSQPVQDRMADLAAAHLPYLFPEVFIRDRPGFDVILGNPPWDEVMVEEPKFWQRYSPGVMGLGSSAQPKEIKRLRRSRPDLVAELEAEQRLMAKFRADLITGPYPGLGTGDVDYYKAFSWRFWDTLRVDGRMGVVFPRSLLNAAGSALWRERILAQGQVTSAVTLTNTAKWVFSEVDARYTIVLLALLKSLPAPDQTVALAGAFHSRAEFDAGHADCGRLPANVLTEWGNGASFPLLPDTASVDLFLKYRQHPRFDAPPGTWLFKAVAEFHATNDRSTFDSGTEAPTRWPVYTGATFNLWDPDAGEAYAWAEPDKVTTALQTKRKRQGRTRSSAFYGMKSTLLADAATLPCLRPRIAFRDVARSTDSRTMIAALVPKNVVLTNKAPYLLRVTGSEADEAYLLGVLSSVILDWYARRYVELSLNLHILNSLPIPRPQDGDPLRARVVEIAGRLAAVDSRYTDWAAEVGVPAGSVTDGQTKDDLIAELDALVAHLYGLAREDVEHVFATFHRGWAYQDRLAAVLTHYDTWKGKAAA